MSGYYDDNDDYDQEQSGPKALRDALEKAKRELAEAKKALEAEVAAKADLEKKVKSSTLRDALTDAGIDPKYARFAERDGVEATPESVKKWVDESKDVYAFLAPKAQAREQEQDGPEDVVDPDLVAGIEAGQSAESGGQPRGSNSVIDTLAGADPSSFKSEAELYAYLQKLGAPVGD